MKSKAKLLIILIFMIATASWFPWAMVKYENILETAQKTNAGIVEIFENNINNSFLVAHNLLNCLAEEIERKNTNQIVDLLHLQIIPDYIKHISYIDINTKNIFEQSIIFQLRTYFSQKQNHLYLGHPGPNQNYLIPLYNAVYSNNELKGILVADLDPKYFAKVFQQIHETNHISFSIVNNDGNILSDNNLIINQTRPEFSFSIFQKIKNSIEDYVFIENKTAYIHTDPLYLYSVYLETDQVLLLRTWFYNTLVGGIFILGNFILMCLVVLYYDKLHELKVTNQELKKLTYTDALTNLYNRRKFLEDIQTKFEYWRRSQEPYCVVMADIDHFKSINDMHGHKVGDLMLKEVARILSKHTRPYDTVARWGGEEFLSILANITEENAFSMCERLRKNVESIEVRYKEHTIKATISIGVSQIKSEHNSYDTAITEADKALYHSKNTGRNKTTLWSQL